MPKVRSYWVCVFPDHTSHSISHGYSENSLSLNSLTMSIYSCTVTLHSWLPMGTHPRADRLRICALITPTTGDAADTEASASFYESLQEAVQHHAPKVALERATMESLEDNFRPWINNATMNRMLLDMRTGTNTKLPSTTTLAVNWDDQISFHQDIVYTDHYLVGMLSNGNSCRSCSRTKFSLNHWSTFRPTVRSVPTLDRGVSPFQSEALTPVGHMRHCLHLPMARQGGVL